MVALVRGTGVSGGSTEPPPLIGWLPAASGARVLRRLGRMIYYRGQLCPQRDVHWRAGAVDAGAQFACAFEKRLLLLARHGERPRRVLHAAGRCGVQKPPRPAGNKREGIWVLGVVFESCAVALQDYRVGSKISRVLSTRSITHTHTHTGQTHRQMTN